MSRKARHLELEGSHESRAWKAKAGRRSAPGSAPGMLVHNPEALQPEITVLAYGPEALTETTVETVEGIEPFIGGSPVLWINVEGLGDLESLRHLGERFGIHPLALEDAVHLKRRAKVEAYEDQLFVVARCPQSPDRFFTRQAALMLGQGFVITFLPKGSDRFEPVRERIRNGVGRIRGCGADYLAYALIDTMIDHYFPVLEHAGELIEELEAVVLAGKDQSAPSRIHAMKGRLLSLRRDIWPHRDMLGTLIRDAGPLVTAETGLFLRDCHDHAVQVIELIETYREVCSDLMNTYLSSVSNRMNEVMKVLTIIATIFIPLGFIAGLYGMNFNTETSPFNMPELNSPWGYPLCIGAMGLVAGGLLWYFKHRGWLSRK